MEHNFILTKQQQKGLLKDYTKKAGFILNKEQTDKILEVIEQHTSLVYSQCLELSHYFSTVYQSFCPPFQNYTFLSDISFEALLLYHQIEKEQNKKLQIFHHSFSSLTNKLFFEAYDLFLSCLGITYQDLYQYLGQIIGTLKTGGTAAILLPTFWFQRNDLTKTESEILNYAKKQDRKWTFPEPIEPLLTEKKAILTGIFDTNISISLDRFSLAWLSSIDVLYQGEKENSLAILDICPLPAENIPIRLSILLIQKSEKTITAENLFKI